ncbi:MAG: ATP-binding protein [bacterium]|nr:ATP-binding protein [bacterium]
MFTLGTSITAIAALGNIILGFLVILRNHRNLLHISFFIFSLLMALWVFSNLIFSMSPSLFLLQTQYALGGLVVPAALLWMLILIYGRIPSFAFIGITITGFLLFFASYFNGLLLKNLTLSDISLPHVLETGPLYDFYGLTTGILFLIILVILIRGIHVSPKEKRSQLFFILLGSLAFGGISVAINFIFPLFSIVPVAPYDAQSSLLFVGFSAYAILRHHLFSARIVATELFIVVIWILLFAKILLSKTLGDILINSTIFLSIGFFSILLIRSSINETRQKEELQKAYEELKRLDKAKSEFVSIASHQLRTPLTAIKGYISMIIEGGYKRNPKRQKEVLESVYQSNERLIHLVNDLLSLSRIESGKIEVQKESANIEKLAQEVVNELSIKAKEKNIDLTIKVSGEKIPSFFLDTEKVRNVLLNLLDNAIRYTEKGSVIVKIVPVYKNEILTTVQMQIQDTGEGMEQEEIEGLFESFRRGKAGQQTWTEGAGLGLYIAKRFLELQGGTISAVSEGKGKGSTFTIELPYQTSKA